MQKNGFVLKLKNTYWKEGINKKIQSEIIHE